MFRPGENQDDASQQTKSYYNANFKKLNEDLGQEAKAERRLSAACFLLGIKLEDLFTIQGQDEVTRTWNRKKHVAQNYKIIQIRWHQEKNKDAVNEAEELIKLLNSARDLLNEFIDNGCVIDTNAEFDQQFWSKYNNLKNKTQYTHDSTNFEVSTPGYWIQVAKSVDTKFSVDKNWDVKSRKSEDEEVNSDQNEEKEPENKDSIETYSSKPVTDLEVIEQKKIELDGPELFYEMVASHSLPCKLRPSQLASAVFAWVDMASQENKRAHELTRKALTNATFLHAMSDRDLFALAIKATEKNIIDIGKTNQEVFFYYLRNFPEILTFEIEKIMTDLLSVTTDEGRTKDIVDALLKDQTILYGLNSSALLVLTKLCGAQGKRVAAVILTDRVLMNKLKDHCFSTSAPTGKEEMVEILLQEENLEDRYFIRLVLKEVLDGNNLWRKALSEETNQQLNSYVGKQIESKSGYGIEIQAADEKARKLKFYTFPELYAASILLKDSQSEEKITHRRLSKFSTEFLIGEFSQSHYSIFHLNLASYLININKLEDAKKIFENLINEYGDEAEKKFLESCKVADKVPLDKLKDIAVKITEFNREAMKEKYDQYLKSKFLAYIKQPDYVNYLLEFDQQFREQGKIDFFGDLVTEIEKSVDEAGRIIVFENKPAIFFDDHEITDYQGIKDIRNKMYDKLGRKREGSKPAQNLEKFLKNKIKEIAGFQMDNHYADRYAELQRWLDTKDIQISSLKDIEACFIRLKGKREGIHLFKKIMREYLPDVINVEHPEEAIKQILVANLKSLFEGESSEEYNIDSLQAAFDKQGLKQLLIAELRSPLKAIYDEMKVCLLDRDNTDDFFNLINRYQLIKLKDSKTLMDLQIQSLGLARLLQTFIKEELEGLQLQITPFEWKSSGDLPIIEHTLKNMPNYLRNLGKELRPNLESAIEARDEKKYGSLSNDRRKNKIQNMELAEKIKVFLPKPNTVDFTAADKLADHLDEIANVLDKLLNDLIAKRNSDNQPSVRLLAEAHEKIFRHEQASGEFDDLPPLVDIDPAEHSTIIHSTALLTENSGSLVSDVKHTQSDFSQTLNLCKQAESLAELNAIQERYKEKSLLNEYAKKRFGSLRFILFVSYDDQTKEDLKKEKQKFETALDNLIATLPEKEKKAAYEFWINSPVVHTHREAGLKAIGYTATKHNINENIKKLKK